LIIVVGPTGSGKSTTLYAALREINDGTLNISTAEDPVEIRQPGMNQVQVQPKIGLDFATIMRSFLRQDPDVIFVGEIRDPETAQVAIRASITGHLVFTTMHTNTGLDVPLRLEGFGVAGVNISNAILMVVNQRLVRRLCFHCREEYNARDDLRGILGRDAFDDNIKLWRAVKGNKCADCGGTGYSGRFMLPELYVPSSQAKEMMTRGQLSFQAFYEEAKTCGFRPLPYTAILAIVRGLTDIPEVLRAAVQEDEFLRDGKMIADSLKRYLAKHPTAQVIAGS
jgi:type IV pilus assembly protein PilB